MWIFYKKIDEVPLREGHRLVAASLLNAMLRPLLDKCREAVTYGLNNLECSLGVKSGKHLLQ